MMCHHPLCGGPANLSSVPTISFMGLFNIPIAPYNHLHLHYRGYGFNHELLQPTSSACLLVGALATQLQRIDFRCQNGNDCNYAYYVFDFFVCSSSTEKWWRLGWLYPLLLSPSNWNGVVYYDDVVGGVDGWEMGERSGWRDTNK